MEWVVKQFEVSKAAYDRLPGRDAAMICKQGLYGGCPVLKLQKAAWTNDDMTTVRNQTGIFFSIWLNAESLRLNRIHYNIHALKLRQLKGYRITGINFATEFRGLFQPMRDDWPNVSVDYGPLTLMQGWIPLVEKTFARDLAALLQRFGKISPIIDEMLEKRRRAAP